MHAFEEPTALEPHAAHEQRGHAIVVDANALAGERGPRVSRVVDLAFEHAQRGMVGREARLADRVVEQHGAKADGTVG